MRALKFYNKHLLYVSSAAFLLIGSFSLNFLPNKTIYETNSYNIGELQTSKLPLLKNVNTYPVLTAQSVYAYDVDSAVVLYQKNPDARMLPASTTKMMTALVALENYELTDVFNTGQFRTVGSSMGLTWNENISVEELLYGLLVQSGNDAAEVLASNYPTGRDAFILEMNKKAHLLSARNTQFKNPSGLDQDGQVSTARDLARIAQFAMFNPVFSKIVGTESHIAKNIEGNIAHKVDNRNELLGKVEGVLGVKTGWTENARENLVTFVERDDKKVMIALLGSQDRFGETEELIDWIFENYDWRQVSSPQS